MESWRDGGLERWRNGEGEHGEMERLRYERTERWRDGGLESGVIRDT